MARAWRTAEALKRLIEQVNQWHPRRNKASDGTIGDAAHASRSSDHNPWVSDGTVGVVTAADITHDPENGVDCSKLVELWKNDPRVKYVIWNRRIFNPEQARKWRPYGGKNPHDKHAHVSVHPIRRLYDSRKDWEIL